TSDRKLAGALDAVWKSGDADTVRASKQVAEAQLGKRGFEIGLGLLGGTTGGIAGGLGMRVLELRTAAAKTAECEGGVCEVTWSPGRRPTETTTTKIDSASAEPGKTIPETNDSPVVNPRDKTTNP